MTAHTVAQLFAYMLGALLKCLKEFLTYFSYPIKTGKPFNN